MSGGVEVEVVGSVEGEGGSGDCDWRCSGGQGGAVDRDSVRDWRCDRAIGEGSWRIGDWLRQLI